MPVNYKVNSLGKLARMTSHPRSVLSLRIRGPTQVMLKQKAFRVPPTHNKPWKPDWLPSVCKPLFYLFFFCRQTSNSEAARVFTDKLGRPVHEASIRRFAKNFPPEDPTDQPDPMIRLIQVKFLSSLAEILNVLLREFH